MAVVVVALWQVAPEMSSEGHWFRRYDRVALPLHIAEAEERRGRCIVCRNGEDPVEVEA